MSERFISRERAERPQREICIGGLNNEPKRNASLLMGLDKPDRKGENKPLERPHSQMAGLESPQDKRFLRAEAEEETQAKAG